MSKTFSFDGLVDEYYHYQDIGGEYDLDQFSRQYFDKVYDKDKNFIGYEKRSQVNVNLLDS